MFLYHMRFQIAALLFYLIILYDYLKSKKLPLLSNRCFTTMLIFAGINLCFDMITVYTVSHPGAVPPLLNRLSHQVFIGSLMVIMLFFYLYVEILGHSQKRLPAIRMTIILLPFLVSISMVFFGKLYYKVTPEYAYSYGPMANALYVAVAFYISCTIINTIIFRKILHKDRCISILLGIAFLIIAAVIQNRNPSMLLSGLAVILMIQFMYLSFENPKEHMDETIGTLNNRAFHLMLTEKMEAKKSLNIISVVIDDYERVRSLIGHDNMNSYMTATANIMKKVFQSNVYHYRSNVITIFADRKCMNLDRQIQSMEKYMRNPVNIDQYSILAKSHMDMIDTNDWKDLSDELDDMIDYMAEQAISTEDTWLHKLDDTLLKQKSRYTTIERMLHKAIKEDGFQIVYQPIYSTKDGTCHSAEALVRLKDTTTIGYVPPDEFIHIAEKKGMIKDLGNIVFDQVCRFYKENSLRQKGIDCIDVNLSGIQLMYPDLYDQFQFIIKWHDVSPGNFNLEITETAAVDCGEMFLRNMSLLRSMGFSFSMDDFGTGYSNLSVMTNVAYDLVKLDKSLIWPCFVDNSKKAYVILENVIQMLSKLDIKIVAEGVETKEMADYLTEQGVTYLQGYYYSKPLKEEDFLFFVQQNLSIPAVV